MLSQKEFQNIASLLAHVVRNWQNGKLTHLYETVDGERFSGVNIHSFSIIKVFMEIFLHCLGHKYSLFSIIKERRLYSWKNFHITPENHEKCKSLAFLL